jgi:hypothetical protein
MEINLNWKIFINFIGIESKITMRYVYYNVVNCSVTEHACKKLIGKTNGN